MHFRLKVITPKKVVIDEDIISATLPSADGEVTILPRHERLFTLLNEGIITIRKSEHEDYLAIGGGFAETNGNELRILVSRAYGQDEIDAHITEKAVQQAKNIIKESRDDSQIKEATLALRRSLIDMKLIKKRKPTAS